MRKKLTAISFIFTILSLALVSQSSWLEYRQQESDWKNGGLAQELESHYDQEFPVKGFAVSLWALIDYTIFAEGRKGVEVGRQGWLFTDEEYANTSLASELVTEHLDKIQRVEGLLEKKGINLVVAVIPAKARVYQEFLTKPLPAHASRRYSDFSQWAKQEGIDLVDLLPALTGAKQVEQVFLRTDTHWTPAGASVAAKSIADMAQKQYQSIPWLTETFKVTTGEQKPYIGDLLSYIPLAPFFTEFGPEPESLRSVEFEATSEQEVDLFGDKSYSVALVGTSFSAKPEWGFVGALENHLGLSIADYSLEGKGPFIPMQEMLESDEFNESLPELVIWEIPERYLALPEQQV